MKIDTHSASLLKAGYTRIGVEFEVLIGSSGRRQPEENISRARKVLQNKHGTLIPTADITKIK